jgi:hypothetical protein
MYILKHVLPYIHIHIRYSTYFPYNQTMTRMYLAAQGEEVDVDGEDALDGHHLFGVVQDRALLVDAVVAHHQLESIR